MHILSLIPTVVLCSLWHINTDGCQPYIHHCFSGGSTTAYNRKTLTPGNRCGIAVICKSTPLFLYDLVLLTFMFLFKMKRAIKDVICSLFKATPIINAINGTKSSGAIELDSAAFDPKVIKDFLLDMSFDCNTPAHPRNLNLEAMAMVKLADLGLSHQDIQPMAYTHQLSCQFAQSCYVNQPLDFKAYVAVYTWLLIAIDDLHMNSPEIQNFTLKFGTGESQGHPQLDGLARLLKFETPKFFGSCVTNVIISSTLDGINGHNLESMFSHGFPRPLPGFSAWIRSKTGYSDAYGCFIFTEREFPEREWLACYIQGFPNVRDVISHINDILSFYKERVLERENTLISNLALENGCDVVVSLKDLCAHTVAMTRVVRHGYAREGDKLLKAFDSYIDGYFRWHLESKRYHLDEIGLSLKSSPGQPCKTG